MRRGEGIIRVLRKHLHNKLSPHTMPNWVRRDLIVLVVVLAVRIPHSYIGQSYVQRTHTRPTLLHLAPIESAKTATTTTNSYSAAATRGQASEAPPIPRRTKPITSSKKTEPLPQEVRQARAMTVVISSASDKEKIKNMSTKDLVETLQAETEGIRGVSRLISGDLKIHTESLEVKKTLQEKSEWTRKIADSAAIKTRTYSVRVNSVKMEHIKTANQSQAIGYLQTANVRLYPDLQIKKIAWSTRAIREKKAFSTVHIEVATAETANRVIAEGIIIDYELKDCERFTKGCTMTQCFNYHNYSYIGRSFINPTACGHCAGAHLALKATWKKQVDIEDVLHAVKRDTKPGQHPAISGKSKNAKQRGPCKNGSYSTQ